MIALRPYQTRALAEVRAAYAAGARSVLLVAPCGFGKTCLFSESARLSNARGRRVLVLAHTTELVRQAASKLAAVGVAADIEQADARAGTAPVVVASIATLRGARLESYPPDAFGFVIHDEAHRTNAATSTAILEHFRSAALLGVTATPVRSDQRAMGDAYEKLVVGATVSELQEQGHLVPARVYAPGDLLRASQLALSVSEAYARYGAGRSAVVFCGTREHARSVAAELAAAGTEAAVLLGESKDRVELVARFSDGRLAVLVSVNVITEGFDAPRAAVAILARRFGHAGAFIQACGRVLRPHPESGKTEAIIVDLQGSALVHGTPETERSFSLEGKAIRTSDRLLLRQCPTCGGVTQGAPDRCPLCSAEYPKAERPLPSSTGVGVSAVRPGTPPRPWFVKLVAKRRDVCRSCRAPIAAGEVIVWAKTEGARHLDCRERTAA